MQRYWPAVGQPLLQDLGLQNRFDLDSVSFHSFITEPLLYVSGKVGTNHYTGQPEAWHRVRQSNWNERKESAEQFLNSK